MIHLVDDGAAVNSLEPVQRTGATVQRTRWPLICGLGIALGCYTIARAEDEPGAELVQLVIGLVQDEDKDLRALGFEQVRTEAKGAGATSQFAALLPKLPPERKQPC